MDQQVFIEADVWRHVLCWRHRVGNWTVFESRVFVKSVGWDIMVLVASRPRLVLLVGGEQAHVD